MKEKHEKKKKNTKKYIDITSTDIEFDDTDLIELIKRSTSKKRRIQVFSSNNENEEEITYSIISERKVTKSLPIKRKKKKFIKGIEKSLEVKNTNSKLENTNQKVTVNVKCIKCG